MPVVVAERERSAGRQGYKATGILKRRLCKLDSATYSKHKPTSIHLQVVMRLSCTSSDAQQHHIRGEIDTGGTNPWPFNWYSGN